MATSTKNNNILYSINLPSISDVFGDKKVTKWNKKFAIFSSEKVQQWVRAKMLKYAGSGKDPLRFSITSYFSPLEAYCKYYNMTPSELLDKEIHIRNEMMMNYIQNQTQCYYDQLDPIKAQKKERSLVNNYQSRIKSFFSYHNKHITYQKECFDSGVNFNELELSVDSKDLLRKIIHGFHQPEYRLLAMMETLTGFRINDMLTELVSGKYKFHKYKQHYYIKNFKTQKEKVFINYVFIPKEIEELI